MERIQGKSVEKFKRENDEINKFTGGDPNTQPKKLATALTPEWCNAVQEELCNAVEGFNKELNSECNSQLLEILQFLYTKINLLEKQVFPEIQEVKETNA